MKRVVITGMGALTPIGNNVPALWQSLTEGRSGAARITHFDASAFKTNFACELKNFDITQHLEKNELRRYDPFTQYALVAVEEARQMAGIDFSQLNRNRIGVIWGSGNGGIQTFQDQVLEYAAGNGTPRFNPFFIPRMIVDIAAGVISIRYGLRGPNFATVSACATSNTAIIEAFNYIRWGKADVMVTGGSEAPINQSSVGGFNAARALSTRNDDPATASRPFDPTRDGFVMGEGAGALILESLEHALQRNAPILAEVLGGGMAADAYHLTGTHPDGEGAWLGMQAALEEAGLQPGQIDYINAHATSTDMGDTSELRAIARLFDGHDKLAISATKSMTGHLLGAAGAVEAIACIQAIRHSQVPPTANTEEIEAPFNQLFRFPLQKASHQPVQYAMSNTFGFGGHTATVVFGKV